MTKQEIWKPIEGIMASIRVKENGKVSFKKDYKYEVSSLGRVRNKATQKVLVTHKVGLNQSVAVQLILEGSRVSCKTVASLVASTFIPNPNKLPVVVHINKNKEDNRVENLRWSTPYDLNKERYHKVVSSDGIIYDSVASASVLTGLPQRTIKKLIGTGLASPEGLTFKFLDENVQKRAVQKSTLPKIKDLPGEKWAKMENINPVFEISNKGRVKRIEVDGRAERLVEPVIVDGYIVTKLSYSAPGKPKYRRQISTAKEVYKAFDIVASIRVNVKEK